MTQPSVAVTGRAPSAPLKRKIAAILAADVAGYSRMVAENEEATLIDFAASREIFDAIVDRAGGRIFNTAGDSVMCEFDSAVEAIRAAIDIQEGLRSRNLGLDPKRRIEFRMGLTIGDVVERGSDLLGDGVNIAARLEGLAPPGGICVSRSVHEAVANKLSVSFRELGPRNVKNMPQPVHAYLVGLPDNAGRAPEPVAGERRERREDRADKPRRSPAARLAIVGALLGGFFVGLPALKYVRATIENAIPATSQAVPTGDAAAPPPRNEAAAPPAAAPPTVVPSPQPAAPATPSRPPRSAEKAPQPPAKPAARDAQRTETPARTDPAVKAETAPKPDTAAKPDATAPKPAEPARTLPGDPAAAYASLAREGLLSDARTLPELYHNARFLEAKGDRAGALAAYATAAPLAAGALDLHLRHASLLRGARGAAAVRQAYGALARTNPSDAATLVLALSAEGDDRRGKLESFVADHPDDAAASYLLADALTEGRDGGPTLTDRRLAFESLDQFLDAATSGALAGAFVDRTFLDGWIETARRRRGEIESFFGSAVARPSAAFSRTASGWLARITLPEPATAVSARVGEKGEFAPAALSRATDARTGRPIATGEIELPSALGRTILYVAYRDRSGRDAGPFPLSFDPTAVTVETGRAALERYPDGWVAFRSDIPDLLSFAGLVSNRCAISKAAIGYGDEAPREAIPVPPCDATGAATMPSGTSLLRLPEGTNSVQVKLTYADGSESQVRTFRRP